MPSKHRTAFETTTPAYAGAAKVRRTAVSPNAQVHDNTHAFYLMPSRYWELTAGALLYEARARGWLEFLDGRAGAAFLQVVACTEAERRWCAWVLFQRDGTSVPAVQKLSRTVLVSSRVVSSPLGTCLGAGLWVAEPGPLFPLPWALLPVAGSLAFLAAGDGPGGCSKAPLNRFLSMKPFPYVGKLSYPL